MTIAVAWVRTIRDCEELVFVTDSRVSGDGRTFDACPKVVTLPRGDCAIAFAGYTGHAFPMMQQLSNAIDAHSPLKRGSLDMVAMKSHMLKIFNGMSGLIVSSKFLSSPMSTAPEADFLFGGYSWIGKCFELWSIRYSEKQKRFIAVAPKCIRRVAYNGMLQFSQRLHGMGEKLAGKIIFTGDQAKVAEQSLIERLSQKGDCTKIDMEPFEVVRDMLRDRNHSETIGGAPQVVKVYQYMGSAPLAVYWPDKHSGTIHLQGRPCLGYERLDRWILDPDTLRSEQKGPPRDGPRKPDLLKVFEDDPPQ